MIVHASPMLPTNARVARVKREIASVVTLELEPRERFAFAPGQFNMLYLFGIGEVAISISGDPAQSDRLVHTIRGVGSVTNPILAVRTGDSLGVRGPFGIGWPLAEAHDRDVVIVAGGLGLAPLRPAILHVLAHRDRYRRAVVLYGARTPNDILYRRELERIRGRLDVSLELTVDRADRDWAGHVGVVPDLVRGADFDPQNAVAMICGPEVMMRFAVRALEERGVPREAMYVSMERNMKCALAFCGHCQLGPSFVCKDGPVFRFDRLAPWFYLKEA